MSKYVFTKARRRALLKARRKWSKGMTPKQRRIAMPPRVAKPRIVYPVGTKLMLDVGKKGGHYQFTQKTRYGWRTVKAPKRLLKAGWKRTDKGYIRKP